MGTPKALKPQIGEYWYQTVRITKAYFAETKANKTRVFDRLYVCILRD